MEEKVLAGHGLTEHDHNSTVVQSESSISTDGSEKMEHRAHQVFGI